jgi:hypothetical protein
MVSQYLSRLPAEGHKVLEQNLWQQQTGMRFTSERPIDLSLDEVDIGHIIPSRDNAQDDSTNVALTLTHYDRSKQAAALCVARVFARFEQVRATVNSAAAP